MGQIQRRYDSLFPSFVVFNVLSEIMYCDSEYEGILSVQQTNKDPKEQPIECPDAFQHMKQHKLELFIVLLIQLGRVFPPKVVRLVHGRPGQVTRCQLGNVFVICPRVSVSRPSDCASPHHSRQALKVALQLVSDKLDVLKDILVGKFTRRKVLGEG